MTGILILAKGNSPRCDFLPPKNTHTTQQKALADLGGGFLFPFFSFSHKCKGSCGTGAAGRAALSAARIKGDTLFLEREYPPLSPERKDEGSCPSTPHIGRLALEELRGLRNRVRCTWLRHESSAIRCRYQPRPTPWGASDGSTAADCLRGRLCCARRRTAKNDRVSGRFNLR